MHRLKCQWSFYNSNLKRVKLYGGYSCFWPLVNRHLNYKSSYFSTWHSSRVTDIIPKYIKKEKNTSSKRLFSMCQHLTTRYFRNSNFSINSSQTTTEISTWHLVYLYNNAPHCHLLSISPNSSNIAIHILNRKMSQ